MSLYRVILKRAWDNARQHKYLLFFGLFAALLGNGGELELIFRSFDGKEQNSLFPGLQAVAETGLFTRAGLGNALHLARTEPLSLFFALSILLIIVLLILFLLWVAIVSQSAIVHNTAKIKHDKEHDFKDGLMQGIRKFWPVFGLNILIKIVAGVLLFLIGLPIYFGLAKSAFAANLVYVIMFIVFIPISLALSFVMKYAIAFAVVKERGFSDSIKSGWGLFRNNWLISLEMAAILFGINFLVGLALIFALLILAVPFAFALMLFSKLFAVLNFWLFAILAGIILLLVIAAVGSYLAVFQISAWTHLFIELVGRGGTSKLARVFGSEK